MEDSSVRFYPKLIGGGHNSELVPLSGFDKPEIRLPAPEAAVVPLLSAPSRKSLGAAGHTTESYVKRTMGCGGSALHVWFYASDRMTNTEACAALWAVFLNESTEAD